MAKKKKSGRAEFLLRDIEISSFSARVSLRAVHRRGADPFVESGPWLELRGTTTEPVRDVRDVRISMYPRDDGREVGAARPASVGAIIGTRPQLDVVLTWSREGFEPVWALALSGRLTHGHIYFTKPYRNSGLVLGASFGNEAEE